MDNVQIDDRSEIDISARDSLTKTFLGGSQREERRRGGDYSPIGCVILAEEICRNLNSSLQIQEGAHTCRWS